MTLRPRAWVEELEAAKAARQVAIREAANGIRASQVSDTLPPRQGALTCAATVDGKGDDVLRRETGGDIRDECVAARLQWHWGAAI